MKALVFSDIHGSVSAARFLADEAERQRPDVILLLGDFLYHGPRNPMPDAYDPRGVVEVLNQHADSIIAVAGNCDSVVDMGLLKFPICADFSWFYAEGLRIFLTHGHAYNPENLPPLREGDIFLYGHTHIPLVAVHGSSYLCNPGSISLPKEGHPESFGIIENGSFTVLTRNGETYLHLTYC